MTKEQKSDLEKILLERIADTHCTHANYNPEALKAISRAVIALSTLIKTPVTGSPIQSTPEPSDGQPIKKFV